MWLPRDKSTITEVFWFISSFLVLILFYFIQPIPTINHSPVIHWLLHTSWTQNESIQWSKFCPFQNSSHCSWKGQMSILYPLHLNERLWKKYIHDMYFITCFIYMHIYIDTHISLWISIISRQRKNNKHKKHLTVHEYELRSHRHWPHTSSIFKKSLRQGDELKVPPESTQSFPAKPQRVNILPYPSWVSYLWFKKKKKNESYLAVS